MKIIIALIIVLIMANCGPKPHVYFACIDAGYKSCNAINYTKSIRIDSLGQKWQLKHNLFGNHKVKSRRKIN